MNADRQDDQTHLAIEESIATQTAGLLVPILADTIFIQNLYKKYHWHVEGSDFYEYHLLFDKHATEQIPLIDLIAERIRTLGSKAPGMPADVIGNKTLEEPPDPHHEPRAMAKNLCIVHQRFIKNLRVAIDKTGELGDMGTNDMLISDVLRRHEFQLWFVRSTLA
ncbi:MAG TPA: DNA starvation/stationary phase protection protein [Candidatus Saccharimonadia bacterium]|jgi:starvation-inducible DNA-binding protein